MRLVRPRTLDDAVAAMAQSSRPIAYAGGIEVLLALRTGALVADTLVDTKRIDGGTGIGVAGFAASAGGVVRIGPATPHHVIALDPVVRGRLPLLALACGRLGSTRIRMQGTLGGNFANGHQHTDPGTAAMVHGGTVHLAGAAGRRSVAIDDFWLGHGRVACRPDEIIESIHLNALDHRDWRVAHERVECRHRPPTAIVSFAARTERGHITACRVAVGAVGAVPARLGVAEGLLVGCQTDDTHRMIAEDRDLISASIAAESDMLGSADFKTQLVIGLIQRAASRALGPASRRPATPEERP